MDKKEALSKVLTRLVKKDGRDLAVIANDIIIDGKPISKQLLGQYRSGNRYPKTPFLEQWKRVFGDDLQALIEQEMTDQPDVYNLLVGDLKSAMRETIDTLKKENARQEVYIKELLKRVPAIKQDK